MDIEKKLEERKYEVMSEPKQTWGQFIFRALLGLLLIGGALFFLTGCSTFNQTHDCKIVGGDSNGVMIACPKKDECDPDMDSTADNMCLDPVPIMIDDVNKECIINGECKYA